MMFKSASAVRLSDLAGLEYVGLSGISASCYDAVKRLVQYRDPIQRALILTCGEQHALLLTLAGDEEVVVKSGFTSGYRGEGPSTFAEVLQLLATMGVTVEECNVTFDVLTRLEASALTRADMQLIKHAKVVRPQRWHDYVRAGIPPGTAKHTISTEFRPVIPWAIIDERIVDLAQRLFETPDDNILTGFRRLEDEVRRRTGLDEHGSRLFTRAFIADDAKLEWKVADRAEQMGRAQLFAATFMAYRNPRAHRELGIDESSMLMEFLMLNQLFVLERQAVFRRPGVDD